MMHVVKKEDIHYIDTLLFRNRPSTRRKRRTTRPIAVKCQFLNFYLILNCTMGNFFVNFIVTQIEVK